jgi:hypothetical protein
MSTAVSSCIDQASDADWAYARQKYLFGGKPSGEFEEYAFSLFDATRAVSA